MKITLDITKSVDENASKYFKTREIVISMSQNT